MLSFILPLTVLVIIPLLMENRMVIRTGWNLFPAGFFAGAGIVLFIFTLSLFIWVGQGTLAPWSPTSNLVVSGPYRYMRNPMISGVLFMLLAESLAFWSIWIFAWTLLFFLLNQLYFVFSEEPGLEKRFGKAYLEYKRNVPRWIPWKKAYVS